MAGPSLLLLVSAGAERLSGLIVAALIARLLGPGAFGEFSLILAIWSIFGVFAYLGQAQILSRQVTREPEKAGRLLATSAAMSLGGSLVAGVAATLVALMLGYSTSVLVGVGIVAVSVLWADGQSNTVEACLIGLHRVAPIAVINIAASVSRAAASLVLAADMMSVPAMLSVIGATQIATASALWLVARRVIAPRSLRYDDKFARQQARSALIFTGSGLANIVFKRGDSLIVEGMLGATALGVYSAAYRLVLVAQSVMQPILRLLMARFARAHAVSPADFSREVVATAASLSIIFGTMTIGLVTLGPAILTWLFGAEYAASVPPFLLLSASTVPLVLHGTMMAAANAINLEARTVVANLVNGVIGVAASTAGIMTFGVVGAAVGVVVAGIAGAAQAAVILRATRSFDSGRMAGVALSAVAFPILACAAVGLAQVAGASLGAIVVMGSLCEAGLLWALRGTARSMIADGWVSLRRWRHGNGPDRSEVP